MAQKIEKFEVLWTVEAVNDLSDIVSYIAADRSLTSQNIYRLIKEKCQTLELFPEQGKISPELKELGLTRYREILVDVWKILYVIRDRKVCILSVFDSRRDIEKIIFNKLIGRY
jgi:toxin ParE1/3/4